MKCRHCSAILTQRTRVGEPLIRTRGIVLRADGPSLICPKCKADVAFSLDLLRLSPALVMFRHARK